METKNEIFLFCKILHRNQVTHPPHDKIKVTSRVAAAGMSSAHLAKDLLAHLLRWSAGSAGCLGVRSPQSTYESCQYLAQRTGRLYPASLCSRLPSVPRIVDVIHTKDFVSNDYTPNHFTMTIREKLLWLRGKHEHMRRRGTVSQPTSASS